MKSLPTIANAGLNALVALAHDDIEAAHDAANFLNMDFWDCMESEVLTHTELNDALEDYLGELNEPYEVTVTGYRRGALSENEWALDPDRLIENVYEALDDEHNSGDNPSEPTPAVIEAAKQFLAVVRREYEPWNCEEAVRVIVSKDEVAQRLREAEETPR